MIDENFRQRIVEATSRFTRRFKTPEEPEGPSPFEQREATLRGLMRDERAPLLIQWLDDQIVAAKAQRNTAFRDHAALTIAIGFENGLEAVKQYLTALTKE